MCLCAAGDHKENNMGKYFGTDGFRGEAGVNLTADHGYKVGRFLGCITAPCASKRAIASLPAL